MTNNEIIAEWLGRDYFCAVGKIAVSPSDWTEEWSPATDILLWYGEDGLFNKIASAGIHGRFIDALFILCEYTNNRKGEDWEWYLASLYPSQLTDALVKVIGEEV